MGKAMRTLFFVLAFVAIATAQLTNLVQNKATTIDGGETVTKMNAVSCPQGAKAGDKLKMHYTGIIDQTSQTGTKGKKFDSSRDRNEPFTFTLGVGQVIKGWDQGLIGICPGEKRTLVIPPALGYGSQEAGGVIPGGATLDFEVQCLKV